MARTPQLDAAWMAALGFTLLDHPRISTLQWKNADVNIQVSDTTTPEMVVVQFKRAVENAVKHRMQMDLRSALLPAMGLDVQSEYDDSGYTKREFVGPE